MFDDVFSSNYDRLILPIDKEERTKVLNEQSSKLVLINTGSDSYLGGFFSYFPDNPVCSLRFFNPDGLWSERRIYPDDIKDMLIESGFNRCRRLSLLNMKKGKLADIFGRIKDNYPKLFAKNNPL